MPRQKESANAWHCWNWFDSATVEGRGEAAIVAAMIRSVRRWNRADPARIVVVGMSAGGALAAVLGLREPGLVRAVVVHSGLACGAARSAFTAIGVMQRGPETDVEAIAEAARDRLPSRFRCWRFTARPTTSSRLPTRPRWSASISGSTVIPRSHADASPRRASRPPIPSATRIGARPHDDDS